MSEPIRIRCSADLFAVLETGSPAAQLAVLRDICTGAEKALTLGPHEGEDLVDLLLRLLADSVGAIRQAQLICVMGFDDPRVNRFLVQEFLTSIDTASVLHLGKRLALTEGLEFFRPLLLEGHGGRALAAARFCSQEAELTPRERLRIALLLDQPYPAPPLDEETLDAWLEELAGPHRLRVRRLLEERPDDELSLLWTRRGELAQREQSWLVRVQAGRDPCALRSRLKELLEEPGVTPDLVEQAVRLGLELPRVLLESPHHAVRAYAVAAGLADGRLEFFLRREASVLEARAATFRSSVQGQVELLADPRWEVRAAATAALSALAVARLPLEEIRARVASPAQEERVAAAEVLRRVGDTAWLQEQLPSVSAEPA